MKNSKKKLLQKMEKQDDKGIARKKHSNSISPSLFFSLKLICIVLIPIIYFVYSPFLIIIMGFYVFLFFLSIKAERRMNQSYLKSNKIKIPKFDSAIAMIVIMIALAGTCMSGNDKTQASTFGNFNATQIEDFIGDNNFIGARQSGW